MLNLLLASDIIRSQSSLIPEWIYPSGIGEGILIWLGASVVLMLFFLLRYVMISTFGQLFNLPNGITQHFQEAQSLNQVFIMGITIISLLSLFGSFYYPEHAYQSIIVISLVYLVYRQFSLYEIPKHRGL